MNSDTLDLVADMRTDSLVVTAGRNPPAYHGLVNPPVYRGSTVLAPTVADLLGYTQPYVYGRQGTPTSTALQAAMQLRRPVRNFRGGDLTCQGWASGLFWLCC